MSTAKVGAVLLCGGASRRMGRAKALLPWHGTTMLEYVAGTLAGVVDEIVVVSAPGLALPDLRAQQVPVRVVEDRETGRGPLAGIREGLEALHASSVELAFVTATDAPFLTADFVRFLLSFGKAVAPEVDGYVQSLTAVYPTAAATVAGELLAADRARPLFLLEACDFQKLTEAELPTLEVFRNLNDAASYLDAVRANLAQVGANRDASEGNSASGEAVVEFLGTTRSRAGRATLSVPMGTVEEVVAAVHERCPRVELLQEGDLAAHYLLSLAGREFVRSLAAPVGPGDRLLVMDAAAGG